MKNYHVYIYMYIYIYIYIQKICLWKYTICIYIHIYIQENIQKKNEASFPTSTNSGRNQSTVIKRGLLEIFPFSSMCFPAMNLHVWWIFSCHVWLLERILYMCISTCKCGTSPNTILDENRAPLQSATIVTSAFWPVEQQFQPTRCAWKIELPPFFNGM